MFPKSVLSDIGRSAGSIREAQPGTPERDAQTAAIRRSDQIPWFDLGALGSPDTQASEHLLWFSPQTGKVIKATAYGRFGHDFDRHPAGATPIDYLERLSLSNKILGDTVRVIGKFQNPDGTVGLLIDQDYVAGYPDQPNPTAEEVDNFMEKKGFQKDTDYLGRWFHPAHSVEADDTHTANFVIDEVMGIIPIDLMLRRISVVKEEG